MAKKGVGVYIGRNSVNVVGLSGNFKNPIIAECIKTKIMAQAERGILGKEQQNSDIAGAISSALSQLKARPEEIFFALPEAKIMVRHFDIPLLPRSEQAQAIRFEAKKYIPFKMDEVISDFKIINISKDKKIMRIFFVAAEKADLEEQLKLFKDGDIKLAGIDIAPFALLRVLNINHKLIKKNETVALLQFDEAESSASINIIEANYPTISRDIPITQDREILMEKLVNELRLSFDYYKRKPASKEITRMLILGKGDLAQTAKRLQEELTIPTDIVELSNLIKGDGVNSVGAILAAGAAMNALGKDIYGVNLLPTGARVKKIRLEGPLAPFVSVAAALVLIALLYGVTLVQLAKSQYNVVLGKARALPAATQEMPISALERLKNETSEKIKFLRALLDKKIYMTDKLSQLAANLPDGVWISSLDARCTADFNITMTLQGAVFLKDPSQQMNTATKFLKTLKQDEVFMKGFDYCEFGDLKRDSREGHDITNYSIRCGSRKE